MKSKYVLAPVLSLLVASYGFVMPKAAHSAEESLCPGSVGAILIGGAGGALAGGAVGGYVGRKVGLRLLGPAGFVAGLVLGGKAGNDFSKDPQCLQATFKREDGSCVLGDGRSVECPHP